MINISLLEKLKYFINIINSNASTIVLIITLILLTIALLITYKKNSKVIKFVFVIMYALIMISTLIICHKHIALLCDYLVDNIVENLLFPNLAIYMGFLLLINIIVLISIFSNKMKYYVKSINIVCFAISQLFLYLIVKNIITYNIDVYEKLNVYTNQELLILIELSMQLFVVWICVLLIIKFVDYLICKSEKKVVENSLEVDNDDVQFDFNDFRLEDDDFIEYVPIKKKKYM